MRTFGIDCQGGKGMAGFGIEVSPTCAAISHGTPHAIASIVGLNCINMGGGKSSCSVTKQVSPTFDCAHGGAPVITGRKKSATQR